MAKELFTMDIKDLKALKKFFKKAPKLFKPVSANVLNSLAFMTRKYDIKNLSNHMIIRNEKFVKSSIRVEKAKSGAEINKQISRVYSIKRPRFTGWEEQQTGKQPVKKRITTLHSRGGSKKRKVLGKYRLKKSSKFFKPEQFQGRDYKARFMFMMRVLGSRGGSNQFLLQKSVPTKRGQLGRGAYTFKKGEIKKIQDFDKQMHVQTFKWRTKSLQQLQQKNNIYKIWRDSLNFIISLQRIKK
jgi:hypothetical protein